MVVPVPPPPSPTTSPELTRSLVTLNVIANKVSDQSGRWGIDMLIQLLRPIQAPITHAPARGQWIDHSENRDEPQTSHIFVENVNIQEDEKIAFGLEVDDEVDDENEYSYPPGDGSEEGGVDYEDLEQKDEHDDSEERGADYEGIEQEDEHDDSEEGGADSEDLEQEDGYDESEEGGADYEDLEEEDEYDSGEGRADYDEYEYDENDEEGGADYEESEQEDEYDDSD